MQSTDASSYFAMILKHIEDRVSLKEEEKDYFCNLLQVRTLLPRQYLVQQHEACRYESYVCEGFLRSFYIDKQGVEYTLHFAMEDWWIADLNSFIRQEPATRNVVALERSVVLQIDLQKREELMQKMPVFERFWRILNEKACMAQDQRLLNTITMSGAERYEALLKKYPTIEQRLPQKHIASFLGITPVFLSQIRKNMVKQ